MPKGDADWRYSKSTERWRGRFYGISDGDKELITATLAHIRKESETEWDSVALINLCTSYASGDLNSESRMKSFMQAMKLPRVLACLVDVWPELMEQELDQVLKGIPKSE